MTRYCARAQRQDEASTPLILPLWKEIEDVVGARSTPLQDTGEERCEMFPRQRSFLFHQVYLYQYSFLMIVVHHECE